MSNVADTSSATNNGKQIQKKLLNYARDFALEKLNKTLDKKLSKRRGANDDDDDDDGDNNDGDDDNNDGDGRVNTTTSEIATPKSSQHNQNNSGRRRQPISSSRRSTPLPAYRAYPDGEDNNDDGDDDNNDHNYHRHHTAVAHRQRRPQPSSDAPTRHSHYRPPAQHQHQRWVHPNHGVSRKGRRSRVTHGGGDSSDDEREAAADDYMYDDDDDDDVTTELVVVSPRQSGEMHRDSQRQRSHRQRRSMPPHIGSNRRPERKSSSAGSGITTEPMSTGTPLYL